ncbi:MAG: ribbon-helix-helix protein, CopG family [Deltaproteobacteria bacterium]|nr:ribbon-helix-helix protein, CopG family [Deltaproteobacteria bacterium]
MVNTLKKQSKVSYEQVSIQLDTRLIKKIDAKAKKLNLSRSQLLRNLIETAYEDMVVLDALGLLTITNIGKKIINKIKLGLSSGKYTINEEGEIDVKKKD